jgi:hypothetical protein
MTYSPLNVLRMFEKVEIIIVANDLIIRLFRLIKLILNIII